MHNHVHFVRVKWTDNIREITPKPYTYEVGPTVALPTSPMGIFQLFFTLDILQYIVQQTNQYARECMGQEAYQSWQPVSVEELKAFMGFMILMGIVNLPSLYDYWRKDRVYRYSPVASRISRSRFLDLSRYLHFADNSSIPPPGTPGYNKLGKIEPIINRLVERFKIMYNHHRDVAVDEAMIPFKGRSTMKQYMPMKPTQRGFKVLVLADSHTGYISRLQVYTGKNAETSTNDGLGATVVKYLCSDLKNRLPKSYTFTCI